jgi:sugar/nucleoside kinase (ribokinase family)
MIIVTPDGERSMNTYLGISADLSSADVPDIFTGGGLLFLEGYLFDKDEGKTAFAEAASRTKAAGGRSGIAISDPFCADRHRADFQRLIAEDMDIAIGNAAEWTTLYQTDDLDRAVGLAAEACEIVVCTRSGADVWVRSGDRRVTAPVTPAPVVDATGAGDQFAAGFLHGLATGQDLEIAAQRGVACAREVIGHLGPRPETDMMAVFRGEGLA